MSRLLTLAECAEATGTTIRWWRTACFEKRVPVVHLGRLVRIDERDLEDFILANRQEAANGVESLKRLEPRQRRARRQVRTAEQSGGGGDG